MTAEELQEAIEAQLANYEIALMEATDEEVEAARIKMAKLLTSKVEAYAEQKLDQYKALVLLTKDGTVEELLAKNKELTAALELALEALKDAHVMGDFSDDIEAIKEVLNKER